MNILYGTSHSSTGSYEQSPILSDVYSEWTESNITRQPRGSEEEDDRLRKTLEDAMIETPVMEGGPNSVRMREGQFMNVVGFFFFKCSFCHRFLKFYLYPFSFAVRCRGKIHLAFF